MIAFNELDDQRISHHINLNIFIMIYRVDKIFEFIDNYITHKLKTTFEALKFLVRSQLLFLFLSKITKQIL